MDPKISQRYMNSGEIFSHPQVIDSGDDGWVLDVISTRSEFSAIIAQATEWCRLRGLPEQKLKFIRRYPNGRSRIGQWSLKYLNKYQHD